MLLGTAQILEDCLVRILGECGAATVASLHKEVRKQFYPYSIPAVYKELRKLQEQGVVVKRGKELSLSLPWILNLIDLTEKMYQIQLESSHPFLILPGEGQKKTFRFCNLARVDDFWTHAIILMLQHSKRKSMYQWFPHPWFNLVNSHKSFPFQNALRARQFTVKNIVGGNSFLDYQAGSVSTKKVYEYSFARSPFQAERRNYYSVTDSYLLTVRLSAKKAAEIDRFYDSVRSANDFTISKVQNLMGKAAHTIITIEANKIKVRRIWNRFVDYFNVSSKSKL